MIELRSGEVVLKVDPTDGGRIVSLIVGGVERILPKAWARATTPPIYWGCYPMVPWPGRLAEGRIPTDDGEVRLEPNLPPAAIHGLGFDKPWDVVERTATAVTMACDMRGLGWPFGGRARQTLRIGSSSLDLELEVGEYKRPGPAGLGWHPWFARPRVGDLAVRLDASEVLVVDADLVPTGAVRATSPALVRWPDLDLAIEFGDSLNTVVIHTPSEGVCVEPQTMWPNAPLLAARGITGTGLRVLEPGESLRASERWTWRAA